MSDDVLFQSAHNALLFAFNFSGQQYERPMMNRLADDPVAYVSKGLSGMDGAAQAGMIMSRIMLMSPLSQYIVFAHYAPKTLPCECFSPCCAGSKPNPLWVATINEISRISITAATPGALSYRVLRDAIVRKLFADTSEKADVLVAAEKCGLEKRQAYNHQAAIKLWLDGTKAKTKKGKITPGVMGVRGIAFEHIDRLLVDSGIAGGVELDF